MQFISVRFYGEISIEKESEMDQPKDRQDPIKFIGSTKGPGCKYHSCKRE